MQGDFSRDTFHAGRHYSRVLLQQGRVILDADWNESSETLTHYLRALAADLVGPHGGPGDSFRVEIDSGGRLIVQPGRYYVEGVLCENSGAVSYAHQPHLIPTAPLPHPPYLVYLDVWERFVSAAQDESLRDPALGGADTCARTQVVWQMKTAAMDDSTESTALSALAALQAVHRGALMATAGVARTAAVGDQGTSDAPHYQGKENRLYRVEIHQAGVGTNDSPAGGQATFKWSRVNGSAVYPLAEPVSGDRIVVEPVADGSSNGLRTGDVVELVDDDYVLRGGLDPAGQTPPLYVVMTVEARLNAVTLKPARPPRGTAADSTPAFTVGGDMTKRPMLRRWDRTREEPQAAGPSDNGLGLVREGAWIELEEGICIRFETSPDSGSPRRYLAGDYWQIAARVATADIEWPGDSEGPVAQPPRGIHHAFAPLAVVTESGITDLRRKIATFATR